MQAQSRTLALLRGVNAYEQGDSRIVNFSDFMILHRIFCVNHNS